MLYLSGQVVFVHSDQVDNPCPSSFMLSSSQSLLVEYIRGDMEGLKPEFALCGSKKLDQETWLCWTHMVEKDIKSSHLGKLQSYLGLIQSYLGQIQ